MDDEESSAKDGKETSPASHKTVSKDAQVHLVLLGGLFASIATIIYTAEHNQEHLGALGIVLYSVLGFVFLLIIGTMIEIAYHSSAHHRRSIDPVLGALSRFVKKSRPPSVFKRRRSQLIFAAGLSLILFACAGGLEFFVAASGPSQVPPVWINPASPDDALQSDLQTAVDGLLNAQRIRIASSASKKALVVNLTDLSWDSAPDGACAPGLYPQRVDATVSVSTPAGQQARPAQRLYACDYAEPNMFPDDASQFAYHKAILDLAQKIVTLLGTWQS